MRVLFLCDGRFRSLGSVIVVCATIMCLAAMLLPTVAHAQNTEVQQLLNRLDRLQRELSTLQSQVYKGEAPRASAVAPISPAAGGSRNAGRNSTRITQLESELQKLTGRIEEIGFRTRQIQARLGKLVSDMDHRLTALEGVTQSGAVPQSVAQSSSLLAPKQAMAAARQPPAVPSPVRGAPPGVLGTIPENMAVSSPRGPANAPPPPPSLRAKSAAPEVQTGPAALASVLPAGTPKAQYDYAKSLMQKGDFAKAETALKAFIYTNPKDGLTGNAHYWLGETFYVRRRYHDAAFAFAEVFQNYPKGNKAPDSLLKLGMSLDQLGRRREACTTYSELLSTFPKVAAWLKARVKREQRRAKCR